MEGHEVTRSRWNGWTCPWHPLQCLAWFFILLFAFLHFGVFGHYILGYWRVLIFAVPGIVVLVLLVSMIVATSINPAEPAVREKLAKGQFFRPKFDRNKFPHAIHNNYCQLCQLNVSTTAKHCRTCDKCILEFDHHCKWLNNCVGSRNYKWFLVTVWSAIVGLLLFLFYSISLLVVYFIGEDGSLLRYNCASTNLTACDPNLHILVELPSQAYPVFPTLCCVFAVLAMFGLGLLFHLAGFHIYLWIKGQSTYEYFNSHRSSVRESPRAGSEGVRGSPRAESEGPSRQCWTFKGKGNRVTPRSETASVSVQSEAPPPAMVESSPRRSLSDYSRSSVDSAGHRVTTLTRTTPPRPDSHDNLTDEQKLVMVRRGRGKGPPPSDSEEMVTTSLRESSSSEMEWRGSYKTFSLISTGQKDSPLWLSPPPTPPIHPHTSYEERSSGNLKRKELIEKLSQDKGESFVSVELTPATSSSPPPTTTTFHTSAATTTLTTPPLHTPPTHLSPQQAELSSPLSSNLPDLVEPEPLTQDALNKHGLLSGSPPFNKNEPESQRRPSLLTVSSEGDSPTPLTSTALGLASLLDAPSPHEQHTWPTDTNTTDPSPSPMPSTSAPPCSCTCNTNDRRLLRETPLPPIYNPVRRTMSGTPRRSLDGRDLERTGNSIDSSKKRVSFGSSECRLSAPARPLPPIGSDEYTSDAVIRGRCLPPLAHTLSDVASLNSSYSSHSQLRESTTSLPLPDPRYSLTTRSTSLSPLSSDGGGARQKGRSRKGRMKRGTDDDTSTGVSLPDILSINSVSEC